METTVWTGTTHPTRIQSDRYGMETKFVNEFPHYFAIQSDRYGMETRPGPSCRSPRDDSIGPIRNGNSAANGHPCAARDSIGPIRNGNPTPNGVYSHIQIQSDRYGMETSSPSLPPFDHVIQSDRYGMETLSNIWIPAAARFNRTDTEWKRCLQIPLFLPIDSIGPIRNGNALRRSSQTAPW